VADSGEFAVHYALCGNDFGSEGVSDCLVSQLPRLRVPAIGLTQLRPFSSFTNVSGDEPTSVSSPSFRKNM
jgi:hypothetical protein